MIDDPKYDLSYWQSYDRSKVTLAPSTFAQFCAGKLVAGQTLLDVCAGNERDSTYFRSFGVQVTAFDHETVNLLDKKPKFGYDTTFDNVYCRFVLHCLPEHLEDYVLLSCEKVINLEGLLFIEVRSDKGIIPDRLNNHYRRLINFNDLCTKLKYLG